MNELIKRITDRVGINEDQARGAAQTVIEYLKQKLPSSMSSHLDSLLGSGESGGGNIAEEAGKIFGR